MQRVTFKLRNYFSLKELKRGLLRRGSTSNASGSQLEYDPVIHRKFSLQVTDDSDKRLHTSQAHLSFDTLDKSHPL